MGPHPSAVMPGLGQLSHSNKRTSNGVAAPFSPFLPAEVVGKILSFTGEDATFIARAAVLGRSWRDAVEYLDHLEIRLRETSRADRAIKQQQGFTRLVLQARRVQILDIEFTHSQDPLEDKALSSQSVAPAAVLEPETLAQWIVHTKPSLLQLAVAVTSSRNPILKEGELVESIMVNARGATKLNKLWLHNLDLDLPTLQGEPKGTFPIMAASLKPRRVSQLFINHFFAQSPKLLFCNVDLATNEQNLTFTSKALQRLAITVLPNTSVKSMTFNIPSLLRFKLESPYPFDTCKLPLCSQLGHIKVDIYSPGPQVEDNFELQLPADLPLIESVTLHLPTMSWVRAKEMIGHLRAVKHVALTRSMDSVLSRADTDVEELISAFPRLLTLYLGEAICSDVMGSGAVDHWTGTSKWKELQALRVVTTNTSRDSVTAISKLVRKCPNLMVLEIARLYGCEEDRVTAEVAGDSGYESSDSQGQPLLDYQELERENLTSIAKSLRKKYPQLQVKADFGVGEYDYHGWQFSVICRPNRDAL